jgi:hypothetical protein
MAIGQDMPKAVELNYAPIPARPQPIHRAAPAISSTIPQASGIKFGALVIGTALGILCWAVLILAYIYFT